MSMHTGNTLQNPSEFTNLVCLCEGSDSRPEHFPPQTKFPAITQKISRATAHVCQLLDGGPLQRSPESLDLARLGLGARDSLLERLRVQTKFPPISQMASNVVTRVRQNRTPQKDMQ